MPSFEERVGEPIATDKVYLVITRSELLVSREYVEDTGQPAKIVYFCPECKQLTVPKRLGKKFRFTCPTCKYDSVAFGTEKSIGNYYRLTNAKKQKLKE